MTTTGRVFNRTYSDELCHWILLDDQTGFDPDNDSMHTWLNVAPPDTLGFSFIRTTDLKDYLNPSSTTDRTVMIPDDAIMEV